MKALYYGDNLQVLRDSIAPESVDLIYLDPPFNSSATYNVGYRGSSGRDRMHDRTAACSRGCSLTRGLDVKLFLDAPAGFTVLSAVGAGPSA